VQSCAASLCSFARPVARIVMCEDKIMYWTVNQFPQYHEKEKSYIKSVTKYSLNIEKTGKRTAVLWLVFLFNFMLFLSIWNIWIGPYIFGNHINTLSIVAGLLCGAIYYAHLLWYINRIVYPAVCKHEMSYSHNEPLIKQE